MNYKELFNQLINTGGFTCGWDQLDPPKGQFIVSITNNRANIPSNEKELKALLVSVLEQKEYKKYIGDPNYCFGAWIDKDIIFVDINRIFDDFHSAIICGIESNQKALFDIQNNILYTLPQCQTHGTETQKKDYKIKLLQSIKEQDYFIDPDKCITLLSSNYTAK